VKTQKIKRSRSVLKRTKQDCQGYCPPTFWPVLWLIYQVGTRPPTQYNDTRETTEKQQQREINTKKKTHTQPSEAVKFSVYVCFFFCVGIQLLPGADLVLGVSASVLSGSLTVDLCSVHTELSRCWACYSPGYSPAITVRLAINRIPTYDRDLERERQRERESCNEHINKKMRNKWNQRSR